MMHDYLAIYGVAIYDVFQVVLVCRCIFTFY